MTQILIADDETSIRTILTRAMEKKGFEVVRAKTGGEALEFLKNSSVDLALLDIRMPDLSGLDILSRQNQFPSRPLIFMMTAQDTMENAVEAMKRGAYDYLTKPFDLDELSLLVDRALETRRLQRENEQLKREGAGRVQAATRIIGKTKNIQSVFKIIGKVANQDVTVLIHGESGTGKELIARAVHEQGNRSGQPFVAVNCSAIPRDLLESELFGHKRGAFTGAVADAMGYFEQANHGTLFLDEIGDMPMGLQAKLLRVLQDKKIQRVGDAKPVPVDVRIIAATNQNLEERIKKGQFREDLYFRLNVVPISLPPLRDRKNDIPLLAGFFMEQAAREFKMPSRQISPAALSFLEKQPWPGNVRELENLIKRVFVLSQGAVLEKRDFELLMSSAPLLDRIPPSDDGSMEEIIRKSLPVRFEKLLREGKKGLYDQFIPAVERPLIELALAKTGGNQIKAASLLGINRNTLRKKIRELKINIQLSVQNHGS
ncbi:MAG: sigma-54-dependent Fis family transcriptional regulator [Deltaproteobacteria bacterium]|nr:sigma-54-dependent Fis family transcriptional regulator [Deltaproteobacteria bacterium]